jgi:hypothetical protein
MPALDHVYWRGLLRLPLVSIGINKGDIAKDYQVGPNGNIALDPGDVEVAKLEPAPAKGAGPAARRTRRSL